MEPLGGSGGVSPFVTRITRSSATAWDPVIKYAKRFGQRPEIKTLRVLGNQRLTTGGTIKRAKAKRPLSVKKRRQGD